MMHFFIDVTFYKPEIWTYQHFQTYSFLLLCRYSRLNLILSEKLVVSTDKLMALRSECVDRRATASRHSNYTKTDRDYDACLGVHMNIYIYLQVFIFICVFGCERKNIKNED